MQYSVYIYIYIAWMYFHKMHKPHTIDLHSRFFLLLPYKQ